MGLADERNVTTFNEFAREDRLSGFRMVGMSVGISYNASCGHRAAGRGEEEEVVVVVLFATPPSQERVRVVMLVLFPRLSLGTAPLIYVLYHLNTWLL